jgi:hypothetical protein
MDYTKKKPLARAAQSSVNSCGADTNYFTTREPALLDEIQLKELLGCLSPAANQARRFVKQVALEPDSPTNTCNRAAGAVNLSDLAQKYNPALLKGGYYLDCQKPKEPIINRWGEDSGQQLWGLYSAVKIDSKRAA